MKKAALAAVLLSLTLLCACSDSASSSAADTTSAAKEESTSQEDSKPEAEEESSSDASSKILPYLDSLRDDEIENLTNLIEEYDNTDEFLNSGFIEKYYEGIDFSGDNMIPECDDSVITGDVNASIGCYWIGYEYNNKKYGICKNVLEIYGSAEELYEHLITLNSPQTIYEYDNENDLVTVKTENPDNVFIEKITPSSKVCEIFCSKEGGATLEEIIEFSKHLKL